MKGGLTHCKSPENCGGNVADGSKLRANSSMMVMCRGEDSGLMR